MLLEALLSVILLSAGLLAIMQSLKTSIETIQFRRTYQAPAQRLADSLLAEIELRNGGLTNSGIVRGERGHLTYEISSSDWPYAAQLKEVRVTVSWTNRGKPGSLSFTTLLPSEEIRGPAEAIPSQNGGESAGYNAKPSAKAFRRQKDGGQKNPCHLSIETGSHIEHERLHGQQS